MRALPGHFVLSPPSNTAAAQRKDLFANRTSVTRADGLYTLLRRELSEQGLLADGGTLWAEAVSTVARAVAQSSDRRAVSGAAIGAAALSRVRAVAGAGLGAAGSATAAVARLVAADGAIEPLRGVASAACSVVGLCAAAMELGRVAHQ